MWGAAAGLLGAVGHLFTKGHFTTAQYASGDDIVSALDRTSYHVGAVAGFLAVGCLLVAAAGWRRWGERCSPDSLAARLVPMALNADAAPRSTPPGVHCKIPTWLTRLASALPYESAISVRDLRRKGPFLAVSGRSTG